MILGFFPFSVSTAAYDELTRAHSYDWAEQRRVGQLPRLQFTGPNSPVIQLRGTLIPPFTGTRANVARIRLMAEQGKPLLLIAGTGLVLGRWVITEISDTGTFFAPNGQPRRTEFNLALKKYDDGAGPFQQALTKISNLAASIV
jgi:phage protein U